MDKSRIFHTVIIGAGPSGMTAAIRAAGHGRKVLLLDRLDQIGKKLLVTGNGRCNLTNLDQMPEFYRSDTPEKAWDIYKEFDELQVLKLFKKLGIITKDRDGYVYPYNDQASAVRDAFEEYLLALPEVTVKTGEKVREIRWLEDKKMFSVGLSQASFFGYSVIIATGGLAGVKLGCEGDGYRFADYFGHSIIPPLPALTALVSGAPFLKKLSGVRCRAGISLYIDDSFCCAETGELQWTDYGISGVAVFCLSRFAIRALSRGKKTEVCIDFMPDITEDGLYTFMKDLIDDCGYKDSLSLLKGIVARKLAPVLLKEAGIEERTLSDKLSDQELKKLVLALKGFVLRIKGYKSYEKAQTTMGGVPLSELTKNLESLYRPGLFFAGEVVDVDGTCGGYNLQWAFASGKVAGDAAVDRGLR